MHTSLSPEAFGATTTGRMVLSYKYRLLPSRSQHRALARICESQRILYNAALQERIDCFRKTGHGLSYFAQSASLTKIRVDDPDGYGAQALAISRSTLKRLHLAFDAFFGRIKLGRAAGFPRFKSKDRWHSFGFLEFDGIKIADKRIRFKGMAGGLRVNFHRPLPTGDILGALFKRDGHGWFVTFKISIESALRRIVASAVGVDVGIKTLAYLSDGIIIPSPRIARRAQREIRLRQRALARCKRGSRRRVKVRERAAKAHRKIAAARSTYLHQQSAALVRRYDLIAIEALNIKGLAGGTLAFDVYDSAWATLFHMLRYKAERAGATLVEVDPRMTSQACSSCGVIVKKGLAERVHSCPDCGLILDRDHNAALNILHLGVLARGEHNVAGCGKRARGNLKLIARSA